MTEQEIKQIEDVIKNAFNENAWWFGDVSSFEEIVDNLKKDDGRTIYDVCYACHMDDSVDKKIWIDLLKKSAELGVDNAQLTLAGFYDRNSENDLYLPGNHEEAFRIYNSLAEKGNPQALYICGLTYSEKEFKDYNLELAVKYLEMLGDRFDSMAEKSADIFERLGDYDRAIKYYKIAKVYEDEDTYMSDFEVDEENIMSCYYPEIARLYYQKGDTSNAIKYIYKGIAIKDDKYCRYLLGLIYSDVGNFEKAMDCFEEADTAEANYEMGLLYSQGKYGSKPNNKSALECFERAAELGFNCAKEIEKLKKGELNQ